MNIILCTDCGKIMSRYSLKCIRCNRDSLETFKDINSAQLKARVEQLKLGNREAVSPLASAFFVLFVAIAISVATFGYNKMNSQPHKAELPHKAVQTAASSASIRL